MKLVKIDHNFCHEIQNFTLMWADDSWDPDILKKAVWKAQAAYNQEVAAPPPEEPPNDYRPYSGPPWDKYPNMKVSQIKAEWEAKEKVWKEWEARMNRQKEPFATFLAKEGLHYFSSFNPELYMVLHWGHRHGERLDVSPMEIPDLPGPNGKEQEDFF